MTIQQLDADTAFVDLLHQGHRHAIGTGVLESTEGLALVDPGPTTGLARLKAGLEELGHSIADVRAVLLTHIHLDHATASGAIVREVPEARIYVHPRGAIHMIDPTRLLASAHRIYGNEMETLWGEFVAVPAESVFEVDEGDAVELADRRLEVAYTPGHASHHVCYYEEATGAVWLGDLGGLRVPTGQPIPVTPVPEVDLEAWDESIDRVLAWRPTRVIPTHFGPWDDPDDHFAELRTGLERWAARVHDSLAGDAPGEADPARDEERAREFVAWVEADLRERMPAAAVDTLAKAFGFEGSWWGLARYWRKREG